MPWPTWQQSLIAAALSGLVIVGLRRDRRNHPRQSQWAVVALQAATEFTILAVLYAVWRMARLLPLYQTEGALSRALDIVDFQEAIFLPTELGLQEFVMRWEWLSWLASAYYTVVHVPATIAFLVWLFWRQRDRFGQWRNILSITTAFCLFIRFVRVAPPRFLPELGYVDLPAEFGLSPYGPVGTGVSPQFAAMPSIHVAWAAIVSFGIVSAGMHRYRAVWLGHLVVTLLVVSATGHHWWLDGIVAIGLVGIAWLIDRSARWLLAQVVPSGGGSGQTESRTESNVVAAPSPSIPAKA
ncbi:MAG: phosphatase PAP2 family protein [Actinomycetota bacterium]